MKKRGQAKGKTALSFFLERIYKYVAMAVSFVAVPIVSLITIKKDKNKEKSEEIFNCYKEIE